MLPTILEALQPPAMKVLDSKVQWRGRIAIDAQLKLKLNSECRVRICAIFSFKLFFLHCFFSEVLALFSRWRSLPLPLTSESPSAHCDARAFCLSMPCHASLYFILRLFVRNISDITFCASLFEFEFEFPSLRLGIPFLDLSFVQDSVIATQHLYPVDAHFGWPSNQGSDCKTFWECHSLID